MKHFYPVSTIVEGQGLNITVQSYLDTLDFGLVGCRELVPDLWHLTDLCVEELDILEQHAPVAASPVADKVPAANVRRRRSVKVDGA